MANYKVQINFNGNTYNYPDGPTLPGLKVRFLQDDIIVHLGLIQPPAGLTPFNMHGHTVQVFTDGVPGPLYTVQYFLWNSEYGFDLTPDTLIRTKDDLVNQRLCLPFGPINGGIPTFTQRTYTGPGSLAGVTNTMGQTGERDDIGVLYENSAEFFFNGNPSNLLAFAKGLRPFDVFIEDERTGKPIDKIQYPLASTYPNQLPPSTSPYYIAPGPAYPSPLPTGYPGWDWGHTPEAAYLAYCLTGQRRYLRILQYYANEVSIWSIFKPFKVPYAPTVPVGQTRGVAWSQRNIVYARKATELAERAGQDLDSYGLMPSSYFKQQSDLNLRLFKEFYMADPAIQVHRFWPNSQYPSPWQQDYLGIVLGQWAYLYPGEIDDLYLWDLGNLLPRVDGKSGFPPCINTSYRLNTGPNFPGNAYYNPLTLKATDFDPDWGSTYARLKAGTNYLTGEVHLSASDFAAADADQYNGNQWTAPDLYYHFHVHARLSIAMYLESIGQIPVSNTWPELHQSYGRINKMATNWMAKDPKNIFPAKTSLLSNSSGGISLPSSVSINVGQTVHLALQVDGSLASGPTYTLSDATIGQLISDPNPLTGVSVKGLKAGTVTVTATATGATALTATCAVTVNPLATTMSLIPGSIS